MVEVTMMIKPILSLLALCLIHQATTRPLLMNGVQTSLYQFFQDQPRSNGLGCDACKLAISAVDALLEMNSTEDDILAVLVDICKVGKIESARVCELIAPEFKDELFGVLVGHYATPTQICGSLLGSDCGVPYNPDALWNITLPKTPKPPVVVPLPPKKGLPTMNVLHISDLHWDRMYMEGTNAECGEPLCCRSNDGPPAKGVPGAGKWGDYRGCDTPTRVVENLLETIAQTHKIDLVYLTGDIPAHDVWNQTRQDQTSALNETTQYLMKYLPGVPVYSALGNHESSPVNSFPPPFVTGHNSITWLYQSMVDSWVTDAKWLPKETTSTIIKGGYYTVPVYPGLRVISLNMNMCNNQNWWLLDNEVDPANELQWLIDVLQKAEDENEFVHILGHIPPGSGDCLPQWSWNYNQIINRYESTIRGQFFGHTHKDSFELFYDEKTKRPTSMLYNGGSVTTYSNINPNYRIYVVDGHYLNSSWAVLDHSTYVMNITDANLTDKPIWKLEYTAKAAYGLKELQPRDWNKLVETFQTDDKMFNKYYRYHYKLNIPGPCDASCKSSLLCDLKSARSHDDTYCK
ncbi:sphingomyelin phosphodiesterase-like [Asterias amurensis]|uniref:sphingomyelin phosphodiesterase-like n=1 Tax=Asterias amurensis TaxID=7602 RepID=UPI003AB2F00F